MHEAAIATVPEVCWEHRSHPERVALAREQLESDEFYYLLAEIFRALADETRAKIVYSLLRQELCPCDLAVIVGMTAPAVSHHLRILRLGRLVKSRRVGKQVYYSLDDAHIQILLDVASGHVRHSDDAPQSRPGFGKEQA
jgi:ArsR family transcriptional regulator, lead/cadmium/zinc/bismuth-responsive transcriptional repressor